MCVVLTYAAVDRLKTLFDFVREYYVTGKNGKKPRFPPELWNICYLLDSALLFRANCLLESFNTHFRAALVGKVKAARVVRTILSYYCG